MMADDFDPRAYLAAKTGARADGFDAAAYLKAKGVALPPRTPEPDLLEGMTGWNKAGAGFGLGMLNMLRSTAELAGHVPGLGGVSRKTLGALPEIDPAFAEALKNDPKHVIASFHVPDAIPFLGGQHDITPGNVGNFGGELVTTLPAGMAGRALGAGLAGTSAARAVLPAFLSKALPVLAEGASQGTLLGGPDNRAMGAALGMGFAGGGYAVGRGLGAIARGIVKPTVAAQALMDKGVDLSLGQMEPGGVLSKLEEAGQHSALGGETIQDVRQLARDQFQRVAAKEALAPGAALPEGSLRPGEFIEKMQDGFAKAYDSFHKTPMPTHYEGVPVTAAIRDAFKGVASDPSLMADAATREAVSKFLQNQATILDSVRQFEGPGGKAASSAAAAARPVTTPAPLMPASELSIRAPRGQWAEAPLSEVTGNVRAKGAPAPVPDAVPVPETFTTAEPLMKMRSNIRAELRSPGVAGTPAGRMLGNAEEMITKALEERLAPEDVARLRSTDSQYARFMALNRAVAAAGDSPFGFTPAQLSTAAQKGLSASAKARGYGGSLRDLGALGREVLDERAPRTGAIKQTLPLGLNHAAGPLMSLLNGPAREFALGLTGPQRTMSTLGDLLNATLPNRTLLGAGPNAYLAPLEVDAGRRR